METQYCVKVYYIMLAYYRANGDGMNWYSVPMVSRARPIIKEEYVGHGGMLIIIRGILRVGSGHTIA